MPKYAFECQSCNLKFDKILKMGDHSTHDCPNCHDTAPQLIEGFAFGFKDVPNAPPGNTGVHKDDYPTADHVVGKDSDKRWEQYRERDKVKNQVRQAGNTHALIRQTAKDGSYVEYDALSPVGRETRRTSAQKAVEALRSQRGLPKKTSKEA